MLDVGFCIECELVELAEYVERLGLDRNWTGNDIVKLLLERVASLRLAIGQYDRQQSPSTQVH